jgi:cytochrome c-type biogenesis protein CcmH
MTAFLIAAVVLTAIALAFVLPPLLRRQSDATAHVARDELNLAVLRDQLRELEADLAAGTIDGPAYESARHDLEQRVVEEVRPQSVAAASTSGSRRTAWSVGIAVPVLAASLYVLLGAPVGLDPTQTQSAAAGGEGGGHEVTQQQIEAMVQGLAQKLQAQPDNSEGWGMLARSYNALGRYAEASNAYAQLVKLVPDDAAIMADYADTLAMALDRSLQGEPEKLVKRALAIDPNNVKALALAGSAAYERRDYGGAVTHWQKILTLVQPDSAIAKSTAGSIAEAQSLMNGTPLAQAPAAPAAPAAKDTAAATAGASVEGTVDIDPAIRAQASDSDTVFIFARAAQGPRFPLAVLRKQVKDLPVKFVLDDSMSMTPDAKLSSFPMVVVGARVSKTGNATPSPGDLEGVIEPVRPGAKNLKIRINTKN